MRGDRDLCSVSDFLAWGVLTRNQASAVDGLALGEEVRMLFAHRLLWQKPLRGRAAVSRRIVDRDGCLLPSIEWTELNAQRSAKLFVLLSNRKLSRDEHAVFKLLAASP